MSILTGSEIKRQIELGRITIDPYELSLINANSIDVRLGRKIIVSRPVRSLWLKFKSWLRGSGWSIWEPDREYDLLGPEFVNGYLMRPGDLILASTLERTQTTFYVPIMYGKSTLARRFFSCHFNAGFGDAGFDGEWTLEMHCLKPLTLRYGMKIGQIGFFTVEGSLDILYGKDQGKYQGQTGPTKARD